jgi:hypothetical protein
LNERSEHAVLSTQLGWFFKMPLSHQSTKHHTKRVYV